MPSIDVFRLLCLLCSLSFQSTRGPNTCFPLSNTETPINIFVLIDSSIRETGIVISLAELACLTFAATVHMLVDQGVVR